MVSAVFNCSVLDFNTIYNTEKDFIQVDGYWKVLIKVFTVSATLEVGILDSFFDCLLVRENIFLGKNVRFGCGHTSQKYFCLINKQFKKT